MTNCDGINIVELPPEKVDVVSNEEDFDENELENNTTRCFWNSSNSIQPRR